MPVSDSITHDEERRDAVALDNTRTGDANASQPTRPVTRLESDDKQRLQQEYLEWRKSRRPQVLTDEQRETRAAEHLKKAQRAHVLDQAAKTQQRMNANPDAERSRVEEMIKAKDRQAMSQTGSTSSVRNAQAVSRFGESAYEHGNKVSQALDGVGLLPEGSSDSVSGIVKGVGLAVQAQGMISAKQDQFRQDEARRTKGLARDAVEANSDAIDAMRSTKTGEGAFQKGRALDAFRTSAKAVMAHQKAARAAKAAGRETVATMSVENTLGESVPVNRFDAGVVSDGAVVDDSLTHRTREWKDQRKQELASAKKDLKESARERRGGDDDEWNQRLERNRQEKQSLEAENSDLKDSSRERRSLGATDLRKGYRFALHDDEAEEYHSAREAHRSASETIEGQHEDHVREIESRFAALNKQGEAQKTADRYRSGKTGFGGRKIREKFSKKDELQTHEDNIKELRDKQKRSIQDKIKELQERRRSMTSKKDQQSIDDQIKHHKAIAKQAKNDKSFIGSDYLDENHQSALASALNSASVLRREKDTGLTKDQQDEHDALRKKLDAAKADADSGADEEAIAARNRHQDTVDKFRFVKKHGMLPEEHDAKLAREQRLIELKEEKKTGLTTEEAAKLAAIRKERSDMKGLVKRTRSYVQKHEGETVKYGRAGGVGTSYNEDRAVTSAKDERLAALNSTARQMHRSGETLEGNLETAHKALESNDLEHARNIAMSHTAQNVGAMTANVLGVDGDAVRTAVQTTGKGLQVAGQMAGGLSSEGANRARFARDARSMEQGDGRNTIRGEQIRDQVIDFNASPQESFGSVKQGAQMGLGMLREGGAFEPVNEMASDAAKNAAAPIASAASEMVKASGGPVKELADNAISSTQEIAESAGNSLESTIGGAPELDSAGLSEAASGGIAGAANAAREVVDENLDSEQVRDKIVDAAGEKGGEVVDGALDKVHDALNEKAKDTGPIGAPVAKRSGKTEGHDSASKSLAERRASADRLMGQPRLTWWQRLKKRASSMWRSVKRGASSMWGKAKKRFSSMWGRAKR